MESDRTVFHIRLLLAASASASASALASTLVAVFFSAVSLTVPMVTDQSERGAGHEKTAGCRTASRYPFLAAVSKPFFPLITFISTGTALNSDASPRRGYFRKVHEGRTYLRDIILRSFRRIPYRGLDVHSKVGNHRENAVQIDTFMDTEQFNVFETERDQQRPEEDSPPEESA